MQGYLNKTFWKTSLLPYIILIWWSLKISVHKYIHTWIKFSKGLFPLSVMLEKHNNCFSVTNCPNIYKFYYSCRHWLKEKIHLHFMLLGIITKISKTKQLVQMFFGQSVLWFSKLCVKESESLHAPKTVSMFKFLEGWKDIFICLLYNTKVPWYVKGHISNS